MRFAGGRERFVDINGVHAAFSMTNNLNRHFVQFDAQKYCCGIRNITSYAVVVCHYTLVVISRWLNAGTQFDLALFNDACKPH